MKRYDERRNFQNILRIVEAAAAITFLFYWSFSSANIPLKISDEWFRQIGAALGNGLSSHDTPAEPDLCDQYVSAAAAAGDRYSVWEEGDPSQDKQIVPSHPSHTARRNGERPCVAVKEVRSYRRTRSERVEPRQRECRREFRRSETETVEREMVMAWRSRTMDGLSSEEFRTTVETFIMEQEDSVQENDVVGWKRRET